VSILLLLAHSGLNARLSHTYVAKEFVDFEQLSGTQNETIIKELSIAGENVFETFQFLSPYPMRPRGDSENGLNWDDGHIPYNQLSLVVNEAVAGFAHLYAYDDSKCTLISVARLSRS
jgi:hypothetical protein